MKLNNIAYFAVTILGPKTYLDFDGYFEFSLGDPLDIYLGIKGLEPTNESSGPRNAGFEPILTALL